MNSDIDLLRIYNDYLQELKALQNPGNLKKEIERFETAFFRSPEWDRHDEKWNAFIENEARYIYEGEKATGLFGL